MSDLEGVMLSDYLLLQCISKGGIADVYRARQKGEGNYEVAVKIFRSSYARRESFREYFMAEAEKIGQFDHPNILPLLEYGEGEELLYIVTPFVLSGSLEVLLRRVGGKFSALQALPIIQQLCNAVQYAHNHNVIHGNIKPTNVFVAADGRMLLSDFGIAHSYDDSQQSLTRVGWGSAEYVAPEQSLGLVRRTSDIYSLGVLLFRILTGQPPFTGQTPVEVLLKHVRLQPPSACVLVPTISDAVDGVLTMAMQKRSDDRFASAEEFGNAFLAAVTVAPVASPVARSLATKKLQLVPGDSSVDSKVTPLPVSILAASQSSAVVDPQTPLPAYLAFASQTAPFEVKEESAALPPLPSLPTLPVPPVSPSPLPLVAAPAPESVAEPQADAVGVVDAANTNTADAGDAPDATDVTEIQQKSFLQEGDDAGSSLFWSVDPVEWSPLPDNEESTLAVPLTASEYLNSKPPTPELQAPMPVMPFVASPPETLTTADKEKSDRGDGTWNARLRKILPIIVVILLLLGLLGALLSSFLLPSDPGASSGQTTTGPIATSSGNGTGTGAAATSTQPVAFTATPNAKGMPSGTPTAVATHPAITPTSAPTQPVVLSFSCITGSITLDSSTV
jgi:serine/threonine protein kinase